MIDYVGKEILHKELVAITKSMMQCKKIATDFNLPVSPDEDPRYVDAITAAMGARDQATLAVTLTAACTTVQIETGETQMKNASHLLETKRKLLPLKLAHELEELTNRVKGSAAKKPRTS